MLATLPVHLGVGPVLPAGNQDTTAPNSREPVGLFNLMVTRVTEGKSRGGPSFETAHLIHTMQTMQLHQLDLVSSLMHTRRMGCMLATHTLTVA